MKKKKKNSFNEPHQHEETIFLIYFNKYLRLFPSVIYYYPLKPTVDHGPS